MKSIPRIKYLCNFLRTGTCEYFSIKVIKSLKAHCMEKCGELLDKINNSFFRLSLSHVLYPKRFWIITFDKMSRRREQGES